MTKYKTVRITSMESGKDVAVYTLFSRKLEDLPKMTLVLGDMSHYDMQCCLRHIVSDTRLFYALTTKKAYATPYNIKKTIDDNMSSNSRKFVRILGDNAIHRKYNTLMSSLFKFKQNHEGGMDPSVYDLGKKQTLECLMGVRLSVHEDTVSFLR